MSLAAALKSERQAVGTSGTGAFCFCSSGARRGAGCFCRLDRMRSFAEHKNRQKSDLNKSLDDYNLSFVCRYFSIAPLQDINIE